MTPDFQKNRRKLDLMKKQKILVVDDSALNRELLSEMLSDDYKICEAQNGQEAVELLADHWREYRLACHGRL